jgi:hypothetical protein
LRGQQHENDLPSQQSGSQRGLHYAAAGEGVEEEG